MKAVQEAGFRCLLDLILLSPAHQKKKTLKQEEGAVTTDGGQQQQQQRYLLQPKYTFIAPPSSIETLKERLVGRKSSCTTYFYITLYY
jgi:hypothetical protein